METLGTAFKHEVQYRSLPSVLEQCHVVFGVERIHTMPMQCIMNHSRKLEVDM